MSAIEGTRMSIAKLAKTDKGYELTDQRVFSLRGSRSPTSPPIERMPCGSTRVPVGMRAVGS